MTLPQTQGEGGTTVREAREQYYRDNRLPPDGGYSAPRVRYPVWRWHISVPNVDARRRALPLHDLHHVITGYSNSWRGEAEIAAWELGGGCHGYGAAWLLNLAALSVGMFIAPRRAWRAFRRGRGSRTLYRTSWDDRWLDWTVPELRTFLLGDERRRAVTAVDIALFIVFCLPIGALAVLVGLALREIAQ